MGHLTIQTSPYGNSNSAFLFVFLSGVLADLDPPRIGPPGPNPLADMDPPGPYPLADLDPRGPYPLADLDPPPRIWTPQQNSVKTLPYIIFLHNFLVESDNNSESRFLREVFQKVCF